MVFSMETVEFVMSLSSLRSCSTTLSGAWKPLLFYLLLLLYLQSPLTPSSHCRALLLTAKQAHFPVSPELCFRMGRSPCRIGGGVFQIHVINFHNWFCAVNLSSFSYSFHPVLCFVSYICVSISLSLLHSIS